MTSHRIIQGDCIEGLRTLPDASVHCCVTSPPYWGLRDYGHDGQIGLESTPEAYVARMVEVFREVRRVLRDDGTCWVNLGDSYAAGGMSNPSVKSTLGGGKDRGAKAYCIARKKPDELKAKDLVGIPWRVAFALQADGWWLRQDIIWHKPNPMPESVRDRCTKAHEYVFLLTKSERYYYDAEALREPYADGVGKDRLACPKASVGRGGNEANRLRSEFYKNGGRNRRSVWTVTTKPYSGAHFAVMPPDLVEPCIKAGCPEQCCSMCGKPWELVVEQTPDERKPYATTGTGSYSDGAGRNDGSRVRGIHKVLRDDGRGGDLAKKTRRVVGKAPACDCAASVTMPGTVLDPFAGSGTTLAVAAELGRSGIGCELNPEYIELAEQRIAKSKAKMPLFVA
jgi:site-specific DNA-methyltransferase (adenine-specific)